MAQYMLLLGRERNAGFQGSALTPEEVMKKYEEWTAKLVNSGKMRGAHKLFDGQGRKLLLQNGQVIDGPFTETKETVGGYYVVEAASYEEASRIASECPVLLYQQGFVEVREIEI